MEVRYLVRGGTIEKYHLIGEYYVPAIVTPLKIDEIKHDYEFDDLFEANYCKLCYNLKRGKPFKNYKGSKYYKRYVERLELEYPEYLI